MFEFITFSDQAISWMTGVQFLAGTGTFLFATTSIPILGPTRPLVQGVLGAVSS